MSWIYAIVFSPFTFMAAFLNGLIDNMSPWMWLAAAVAALVTTWPIWMPMWRRLPESTRAIVVAIAIAIGAYFAGRSRGAEGAMARNKEKEARRAHGIEKGAASARDRAGRDAMGGGLHNDDGWRRPD
ncbi:MAG: hypothetical protein ACAH27_05645 [Xanthobacteraceae bacterium]